MKKSHDSKITILFRKKSDNAFSIEELFGNILRQLQNQQKVDFEKVELPFSGSGFFNKLRNIIFVFKRRSTWVHITGEVYYTALFNRKIIITIHDIALALKGNYLKRKIIGLFWYKIPCRIAKVITVVSETSKQELIRYTGVNPQKVKVIPNPISEQISFVPKNNKECKRLLAIGTKPNKNLERLLSACKGLNINLHIIGKLTNQQKALLEELQISYSNDFGISFDTVIKHYETCDIVSFVSTYEGFGIPILEAQAIGRPVITSNISSMPEVAGEGALLVDPYSIEEIREGLSMLINNQDLRNELIEKGVKNLENYKLNRIVEQYSQVYKELLLQ